MGREIGIRHYTLITGGCWGIPQEAVLGANELKGRCIGYSPAISIKEHMDVYHFPTEGFSRLIYIPPDYQHRENKYLSTKYRNISSVADCDAAIFIGGRTGTMNEFTIAYDAGKIIGVLEKSGGVCDGIIRGLVDAVGKQTGAIVMYDPDPASLVGRVVDAFKG